MSSDKKPAPLKVHNVNRQFNGGIEQIVLQVDAPPPAPGVPHQPKIISISAPSDYFDVSKLTATKRYTVEIKEVVDEEVLPE